MICSRLWMAACLASFATVVIADEPREPVNLPGGGKLENVDFERHVMALVGKLGCNAGSCHGSFQGRGAFQLSLFGYDFDTDHEAIVEWVDLFGCGFVERAERSR